YAVPLHDALPISSIAVWCGGVETSDLDRARQLLGPQHILLGEPAPLGDLRRGRRNPQLGRQCRGRVANAQIELLVAAHDVHTPTLVAEVPLQLADNGG